MKVLLTTDGSQSAEEAIRWYCHLPIAHNKCYEVMTVASYQVYGMVPTKVREEFVRLEQLHADESFQRAQAILKAVGIEAEQIKSFGQAADLITGYAKESNADLIVMGAHGRSMIEHMLIGSTSETVARYAHCSVLLIRGNRTKQSSDGQGITITIATDGSDADKQVSAQMNALRFPESTPIHLVTVINHPYFLEPDAEHDAHTARDTAEALGRLANDLRQSSNCIEKHTFEKLHVSSCILDFLNKRPTDLVVVGDKGRSAIGRFFLGSVSRAILYHAPCSVLIVKANGSIASTSAKAFD